MAESRRASALLVEGEASESEDETLDSGHSCPGSPGIHKQKVKTTEDPLTLGLSIMTVTGTVQKHIATLSRQATRESLTLGSLGGSSIVATECGDPACNTNNSILHRKLQDVNIELARNRELVFQEQFLNCSAELKKVDEEVNETTQTYIQESTISIQQSLNTTNQILEQLSLLSSSLSDSGLSQLLPI